MSIGVSSPNMKLIKHPRGLQLSYIAVSAQYSIISLISGANYTHKIALFFSGSGSNSHVDSEVERLRKESEIWQQRHARDVSALQAALHKE